MNACRDTEWWRTGVIKHQCQNHHYHKWWWDMLHQALFRTRTLAVVSSTSCAWENAGGMRLRSHASSSECWDPNSRARGSRGPSRSESDSSSNSASNNGAPRSAHILPIIFSRLCTRSISKDLQATRGMLQYTVLYSTCVLIQTKVYWVLRSVCTSMITFDRRYPH